MAKDEMSPEMTERDINDLALSRFRMRMLAALKPSIAVAWVPNGFDPDDPNKTDGYSRQALMYAKTLYREYIKGNYGVYFLLIKSIVRDLSGKHVLYETMMRDVQTFGHIQVDEKDIVLLETETTGSPTDGLAVARFARDHRMDIIVVTVASPVKQYVQCMYSSVARHIEHIDPVIMVKSADQNISLHSSLMYHALHRITQIFQKHPRLFLAWYNFLNRMYQRRLKGFGRTVN